MGTSSGDQVQHDAADLLEQTRTAMLDAVKLLEGPTSTTRISGIHALELIADTDPMEFKQQVVDILCRYLRSTRNDDVQAESILLQVLVKHLRKERSDEDGQVPVKQEVADDQLWCDCNIDLHGATFAEAANFSGTTFNQNANFWKTTFNEDVDFSGTLFGEHANFWKATFNADANFRDTSFFGTVTFNQARFAGAATFNRAMSERYTDFRYATFLRKATFNKTTFYECVNFSQAIFTHKAGFKGTTFPKKISSQPMSTRAHFRGTKFNNEHKGKVTFPKSFKLEGGLPNGAEWFTPKLEPQPHPETALLEDGRLVESANLVENAKLMESAKLLENTDSATRIAGVEALTDIADTYPMEFKQQVVDILCGYLRNPRKNDEATESVLLKIMAKHLRKERRDTDGQIIVKQEVEDDQLWCECTIDLHEADLTQTVDFSGAIFNKEATFWKTQFAADTNFAGATFATHVNFSQADWRKCVNFKMATFGGYTDFLDAGLVGGVNFEGATFSEYTTFWHAGLFKDANFTGATFRKNVDFMEALIDGINFSEATFEGDACFEDAAFNEEYINKVIFPEGFKLAGGLPIGAERYDP